MKLSSIDQRFLDLMHRIETDQTSEINALRSQIDVLEAKLAEQATRITALEDSLTRQAGLWTRLNDTLNAFLAPLDVSGPSPTGSTD